jgi:hypothetical protein
MAKKADVAKGLDDLFKKTTGEPGQTEQPGQAAPDNSDLDEGNIRPMGVGLRAGEVAALDVIAGQLGIARNALIHYAVRWFLLQYRAGKVDLAGKVEEPPPTKKRLRLPK